MSLCVVVGKAMRTPDVVEMRLRPLGPRLGHRPGQYLLVHGPGSSERPYSICNAPQRDGEMSLLVSRATGGAVSGWMHDVLEAGDHVWVTGPHGAAAPRPSRPGHTLCLAGGSGLAPILALVEVTLASGYADPLILVHSARTERHLLDGGVLEDWSERYPNFRLVTTLTRARVAGSMHGRIPQILQHVAADLLNYEVFIAGSRDFVVDCRAAARASGAAEERLHAVGGWDPTAAREPGLKS